MGSAMTSNAPGAVISIATIEKIKFQIEELERSAQDFTQQIHRWMHSQGFDPERSLLVLPVSWHTELPQFIWPRCVRFSDMITAPVLMRDMLGLNL